MLIKETFLAAVIMIAATQPASAIPIQLTINGYTSNSVTFTLSGTMPSVNSGTLADGPNEIDLAYSGNLWVGGINYSANNLTAAPLAGTGGLLGGNTGGFGLPTNYSWMYFNNDLTGLNGTDVPVTLTWNGSNYLNSIGTGTMDLYWSNLTNGPDASGQQNVLLASASIVNGNIDGSNNVPEPSILALFGTSIVSLALVRRRKQQR